MRIHRIKLRNFRGVTDSEVTLAIAGVTVVEGPNEVGKSSLAEAIDLILEELDSSGKAAVRAVKPVHLDVGAEVELEITSGDYHVIYVKRWHKQPETKLRVLTPAAETVTGRPAHERMEQILAETLDVPLWKALRYQQGTTIAQAALGNCLSLTSALDAAAASSALGGVGEASLWDKVEAERLRYFTPSGRPTSDRMHLDQQTTDTAANAVRLRNELDLLDAAADRHRQLTTELAQGGARLVEQQQIVEDHEKTWKELAAEQRRVDDLAQSARIAALAAQAAQAAHDERQRLIDQAQTAAGTLRELHTLAQREDPGLAAAKEAHRAAVDLRDRARQERRDVVATAEVAGNDYEHFRELMGLELLRERHDRVEQAEAKLGEARAFLDSCFIDEDKLAEIQETFVAAAEARARLTGESPPVRIEALGVFDIVVDGERRTLDAGQVVEERVTQGDLTLTLGDLARITVAAGEATRELQDAVAEAEQVLTGLYRSVGVTGGNALAEARKLDQRRRGAERDAKEAHQALQENLRDLTPQLLVDKIDRAQLSTARYLTERSGASPLPTSREESQALSEQATAAAERARQLEEQREEELKGPAEALDAARDAETKRTVRIELADQACLAAEQGLSAARMTTSDDELAQHSSELAPAHIAAQAAHASAASALAAQDPEATKLMLDNAQGVLKRMDGDNRDLESELTKVGAELEVKGEQGLQDQLDAAESTLTHLQRDKEQRDRRAAAAHLLYDRLATHRAEAKRSYVRPFREQVESLGRIVFGPNLRIELDPEDLQITSRTLDGVTVPYQSLSTGAKEQLCVISRLACAALVNPTMPDSLDRGAPVIIDDAFGYSDASRLERLGAVLSLAGRQSQVIVLTCTPERYRNIGTANVVRLDGQQRRPSPTTAGPNGTRTPRTPSIARLTGHSDAELVHDCLRRSDGSLSRADILARSGLPPEAWTAAIAGLLAQGAVQQEGQKRGTRYRLTSAIITPDPGARTATPDSSSRLTSSTG